MSADESQSLHLSTEFEYTAAELREAVRKISLHNLGRSWGTRFGTVLLIVFAFLIFAWLMWRNSTVIPAAPMPNVPTSPTPLTDLVLPLIPWLLIFLFIWFVVFRLVRRKANPMLERVWTFTADEAGLVMSQPNERIDRKWAAFCEFVPTRNLFLLFTAKATAVVVPKRVFAAPDRVLFQELAARKIRPRISAFPIISPDPRSHL